MNEKLKSLYKTVILTHDKSPHNFAEREDAGHVVQAFNPICGDRFTLFFDVKNGRVCEVSFHGFGCAISKASTSVLVKKMEGKTLEEAKRLVGRFISQFTKNETADSTSSAVSSAAPQDEEFTAFLAARDFPGRLGCATLAWSEMQLFFEKS